MRRISRKTLASYPRPLQGGVQVLGSGGRQQTLAQAYQSALNRANAANESRYQGILSGYDDLSKRVSGELAGVGEQEYRDIDRTYRNMGSDVYQRLVNRGFANSTLPATSQMGVERERSAARSRLASDLARMRADYDAQISQGKMGVMERRTDEAPDFNQMIALSEGLGRGGYGQGYGGGVGMGQPIGITPQQYYASMAAMMPQPVYSMQRDRRTPYMLDRIARAKQIRLEQNLGLAANGAQRPSKNRIAANRSVNLPQFTVGTSGLNRTVPGPWIGQYGMPPNLPGITAVGPYRSGYIQPTRDTWYGESYRSDLPYPYGGLK